MITTEKMLYVTGVILEEDSDEVTASLLRIGVLDFVNIREVSPTLRNKLRTMPPRLSRSRLDDLIRRIDSILRSVGPDIPVTVPREVTFMEPQELEEAEKEIITVSGNLEALRKKAEGLATERMQLEEIRRQIHMFGTIRSGIHAQSGYSYLAIRTGTIPVESVRVFEKAVNDRPSVLIPASGGERAPVFLLVTMKQDEDRTKALLDRFGWSDCELPATFEGSSEEIDDSIDEKIINLKNEEEQVSEEISEHLEEGMPRLLDIRAKAVVNKLVAEIQADLSRTARTVLFSGWLPAREKVNLEEAVRKATEGRYYIEWSRETDLKEEKIKAPVKLSNPPLLRPFEQLVTNYAVPEYGTIDPTPFVAAAYFMMFGLMFADTGHGIVLFLVGLLGTIMRRRRGKKTNLFELITWCGLSSILSGLLFGSFFGFELLPPLWFDYHAAVLGSPGGETSRSIFDILEITIYFGIGVIALGLLLNWINLILKKRWFLLVFDKGGIIGGWLYAAGVYIGFYFVRHGYRALPPMGFIVPAVLFPFLLLALKSPLEYYMRKKNGRAEAFTALTPVIFFMEWIVEVLEISSGYLANTLSFMRVAGLGIAHVSLMSAFSQMADMVSPAGRMTVGAVIILLLGNVLVIGLEGLSAGIQSLRLNYYEFFSKYFSGSGRAYTPVSLDSE